MLLPGSIVTSMPRLLLRTISGECYISDLIIEVTLTMVLIFYDFHLKVLWFCSCLWKMKVAILFLLKCREVSFTKIFLKVSYNMLASVCTFIYLFFLFSFKICRYQPHLAVFTKSNAVEGLLFPVMFIVLVVWLAKIPFEKTVISQISSWWQSLF